jgi:hypothetical protein
VQPPHDAVGSAFDDLETVLPDRTLGVAIGMASAGEPGPERLSRVLDESDEARHSPHMLDGAERAILPQKARDLLHRLLRVIDAAQNETAYDRVERGRGERQCLGGGHDVPCLMCATTGSANERKVWIDGHGWRRVEGQIAPGSTSDLQNSPAGTVSQPGTPTPKTRPLYDAHQRVVEPGDVFDSAHGRFWLFGCKAGA